MSDDDNSHGFQGFMVNRARKQQLAARPAATREHDINRTAHFEGSTPLMHWLSAAHSVPAEIRVYNPLFAKPSPDAANFAADLNPQSLEILKDARIEPAVAQANSSDVIQFERQGYFVRDKDSTPDHPVFSRTIGLRDTFAKEVGKV